MASSTKYYAVRGGAESGVYDKWSHAVNAGWRQKEAFGNCIKTDDKEEADAFVAHSAFPMTKVQAVQGYVARQHFLVRASIFMVVATTLSILAWNVALRVEAALDCNVAPHNTMPICIGILDARLAISKNMVALTNLFMWEIIGAIGMLSYWLAGFLG